MPWRIPTSATARVSRVHRDTLAWPLTLLTLPPWPSQIPHRGWGHPSPLFNLLNPPLLPQRLPASLGIVTSSTLPGLPPISSIAPSSFCLPYSQAHRRKCPSAGPCPRLIKRAGIGGFNAGGSQTCLYIRIIWETGKLKFPRFHLILCRQAPELWFSNILLVIAMSSWLLGQSWFNQDFAIDGNSGSLVTGRCHLY